MYVCMYVCIGVVVVYNAIYRGIIVNKLKKQWRLAVDYVVFMRTLSPEMSHCACVDVICLIMCFYVCLDIAYCFQEHFYPKSDDKCRMFTNIGQWDNLLYKHLWSSYMQSACAFRRASLVLNSREGKQICFIYETRYNEYFPKCWTISMVFIEQL